MRKNIFLLTLFLLTFLKFNNVYSEECDLEFEIGESFSSVTEMLGEPDIDKNIELIDMNPSAEKTNYWFATTNFKNWCPDHHPEETEIRIHSLGGETVIGYELILNNNISKINDKKSFLFYYIQENYGEEAKEVFDPKWLGHISWEKDNKKYYYSKTLRFDVLVEEELIITTNEYRQYW